MADRSLMIFEKNSNIIFSLLQNTLKLTETIIDQILEVEERKQFYRNQN